jgi:hypothetical protein
MVQKINLIGGGFQHAYSSSGWSVPKHVEWVKNGQSAPISVYVDHSIMGAVVDKTKKNYAWLAESSAIIETVINWVKNNLSTIEDNFELIFTHDKRLLNLSPKFKFVICNAVPWVSDRRIYPKTKSISMIASSKFMCPGHKYRQEIIRKYSPLVDHYGHGFRAIQKKEDGLIDYRFSIAMENDNYPGIFCEKITDCFSTGTIPIFWGTPDIGEFFNKDGIIMLEEFDINQISEDLYFSKMDAIKENLERVLDWPVTEDYMYLKYIKQ